jgi:hypothetical protein
MTTNSEPARKRRRPHRPLHRATELRDAYPSARQQVDAVLLAAVLFDLDELARTPRSSPRALTPE